MTNVDSCFAGIVSWLVFLFFFFLEIPFGIINVSEIKDRAIVLINLKGRIDMRSQSLIKTWENQWKQRNVPRQGLTQTLVLCLPAWPVLV